MPLSRRRPKGRPPPRLDPRYGNRLAAIYQRDGGICHLCHMPVPPEYDPDGDPSPTVDHLVPVAYGGSDDMGNLRLAHRLCNQKRRSVPMWALPPNIFDNVWR